MVACLTEHTVCSVHTTRHRLSAANLFTHSTTKKARPSKLPSTPWLIVICVNAYDPKWNGPSTKKTQTTTSREDGVNCPYKEEERERNTTYKMGQKQINKFAQNQNPWRHALSAVIFLQTHIVSFSSFLSSQNCGEMVSGHTHFVICERVYRPTASTQIS